MAGDRTHASDRYAKAETLCPSMPWWDGAAETDCGSISRERVPKFRVVDGLLYRKRLERGLVHYREVLDEDRRHEVVSTLHRRPAEHHLSLAETYKCVAENYWWDGTMTVSCVSDLVSFVNNLICPLLKTTLLRQSHSHDRGRGT